MQPEVSIIVASYNYERYIGATLASIADQTFKNFEVLVVDDGSKDSSRDIIAGYVVKDSRFSLFTHPYNENRGLAATLQMGISKARGKWIAFLESDDLWEPDCLEKRFRTLSQCSDDPGIVLNNIEPLIMGGADPDWFNSYVPRIMKKLQALCGSKHSADVGEEILKENFFPTFSAVMIKKEILAKCSFETPVGKWLDWYIWIQAAQMAPVAFCPEKLTIWRIHPNSWNRRQKLLQYFKDYTAFRKKTAEILTPIFTQKGETSRITYIQRSPILFLADRFTAMMKNGGLLNTLKNIFKRLR